MKAMPVVNPINANVEHAGWEVIFEMAAGPTSFIVGVTTLFSYTDYGSTYSSLALLLENQDVSTAVRAVLDRSHGGVNLNRDLQRATDVAAGEEGCAVAEYSNPGTFVRGQVVNNGGGAVNGRWALLGKRRY